MTKTQLETYGKQILLGTQKGDLQRVYNFIKQHPASAFETVAEALNLKRSTTVGRLSDLHNMGLVEPLTERRQQSLYIAVTIPQRQQKIRQQRHSAKMERDLKRFLSHFKTTEATKALDEVQQLMVRG